MDGVNGSIVVRKKKQGGNWCEQDGEDNWRQKMHHI